MTTETETDRYEHARENAANTLASIREMVERLEHTRFREAGDCDPEDADDRRECPWNSLSEYSFEDYHDHEQAREAIENDALSVEVRSGWYTPGEEPEAEEFQIILTTGGPALRIIGELGGYGSVRSARLEMQDWWIPWQEYIGDSADYEALQTYAGVFYFGE